MLFIWRSFAILMPILLLMGCNSIEHRSEAVPKQPLPKLSQTKNPELLWTRAFGRGDIKNDVKLRLAVTNDSVINADGEGNLFAVDRQTGNLKWRVQTKSALSAGPTVLQQTILLGTREGTVCAYHLEDGRFLWQTPLTGEVLAAPKGHHNTVYVKTQDGQVSALNLADGKVIWRYGLHLPPVVLRHSSSPVVTPEHVLVGFPNGRLIAIHRSNGAINWEKDIALPKGRSDIQRMTDISADPLVVNHTVYAVSYQGRLVALSEKEGNSLWEQDMSSYSGLEFNARKLFVADAKGNLFAIDNKNGQILWKQSVLQGRRLSKPVCFQDSIVVGDEEGHLHWLSMADGRYLNRMLIDSKGIEAPPVYQDNKLYVLGRGGKIAVLK